MSSVYTGVGSNVSQSTSPTITVPADGDALAVTSVNTPMDKLMDYIALLFGGAQTGQATGTPGYAGTGGATAQGLKATAGGGGSPAKGALNLVPQVAPSAPADGDAWVETTTNVAKIRVNGITYQLQAVGGLFYCGNIGSTASTTYYMYNRGDGVTSQTVGPATSQSGTILLVPWTGTVRNLVFRTAAGPTAGGNVTVQLKLNGSNAGSTITIGSGTAVNTVFNQAQSFSVTAGDQLEVTVANGVGVSASVGAFAMAQVVLWG